MSETARINIIGNDGECRKLESVYHNLENANELSKRKKTPQKLWGPKLMTLFFPWISH